MFILISGAASRARVLYLLISFQNFKISNFKFSKSQNLKSKISKNPKNPLKMN